MLRLFSNLIIIDLTNALNHFTFPKWITDQCLLETFLYMTSVLMAYLTPSSSVEPSCRRSCWNTRTRPVRGATVTLSSASASKSSIRCPKVRNHGESGYYRFHI